MPKLSEAHTPGPWTVDYGPGTGKSHIYSEHFPGFNGGFPGGHSLAAAHFPPLYNDKTGTLSREAFEIMEANSHLIVTAVNSLHAIAPGREIELAEALTELIEALKPFAAAADLVEGMADTDAAGMSAHSLRQARAILTKLGLNEGKDHG